MDSPSSVPPQSDAYYTWMDWDEQWNSGAGCLFIAATCLGEEDERRTDGFVLGKRVEGEPLRVRGTQYVAWAIDIETQQPRRSCCKLPLARRARGLLIRGRSSSSWRLPSLAPLFCRLAAPPRHLTSSGRSPSPSSSMFE